MKNKVVPSVEQMHHPSSLMDRESFFANFNGIENIIPITIDQFIAHKNVLLKAIHGNLADKQRDELHLNAHSLRGAIAIFRVNDLVGVAKEIEDQAKDGNLEGLDILVSKLELQISDLEVELVKIKSELAAA